MFNERFPSLRGHTSRPTSADADVEAEPEAEDDETSWLENAIGKSGEAEGSWERVEPIDSGALTIQFGDTFGSDRRQAW